MISFRTRISKTNFSYPSGGVSVAYNATYYGNGAGVSSINWNHTTGSGSNRLIVVMVGATGAVSGATYNGTSMSLLNYYNDFAFCYIYYLVNPASGTKNIVVTSTAPNNYMEAGSVDFINVNQGTPLASFQSGGDQTGTPSLTVSGASGDIAIGAIKYWTPDFNAAPSGGQTQLFNTTSDNSWKTQGEMIAGGTSVSIGWTVPTDYAATFAAAMIKKA